MYWWSIIGKWIGCWKRLDWHGACVHYNLLKSGYSYSQALNWCKNHVPKSFLDWDIKRSANVIDIWPLTLLYATIGTFGTASPAYYIVLLTAPWLMYGVKVSYRARKALLLRWRTQQWQYSGAYQIPWHILIATVSLWIFETISSYCMTLESFKACSICVNIAHSTYCCSLGWFHTTK